MKKFLLSVLAIILCSNIFAQSYLSPEPVDAGSKLVTDNLLGTWKEQKNLDAGQAFQVFKNPNMTGHFQIVPAMGPMTPGILSNAGDQLFVSLYEAGGKERPEGYYIFRLELKGDAELRLIPLKQDLKIPEGKTLKYFLANAKPEDIDAGYALWFAHKHYTKKQPLDKEGRAINITKKE